MIECSYRVCLRRGLRVNTAKSKVILSEGKNVTVFNVKIQEKSIENVHEFK